MQTRTDIPAPLGGQRVSAPSHLEDKRFWRETQNAHFTVDRVTKAPGMGLFGAASEYPSSTTGLNGVPTYIDQLFDYDNNSALIVGTTNDLFWYDTLATGVKFTSLKGSLSVSADLSHFWHGTFFREHLYLTNGINEIFDLSMTSGSPTSPAGKLTGEYCQNIITFEDHLIQIAPGSASISRQMVKWSDKGTANFTGGDSGSKDFADNPDWLTAAALLGSHLALYKERGIILVSFVGSPYVFDFHTQVDGVGTLSAKGIVNLGDEHIFIGNDNIYVFNGLSIKGIGDYIWQDFFNDVHPRGWYAIQGFFIEEDALLMWLYPSKNQTIEASGQIAIIYDKALCYNMLTGAYWFRDLPQVTCAGYYFKSADISWATASGGWSSWGSIAWSGVRTQADAPSNLFGRYNQFIDEYDTTLYTIEGSDYETSIVSSSFRGDAGDGVYILDNIQFVLSSGGSTDFKVYIGVKFSEHEALTWKGPFSVLPNGKCYCRVAGAFFVLKLVSSSGVDVFSLTEYDPQISFMGKR